MTANSLPSINDPARLASLRETGLLDAPPEKAFDRLTRLATRLLNAPVALVSLVDENRQFFMSCVGLPEPWGSARQTPLSHSFCQHTVETGEALVIEDARQHELVRDNLAIPDLGVIAYAGIPLMTMDQHSLGSFCVIDHRPRRWSDEELDILRELATSVVTEIELRRLARHADQRAVQAEQEREQKVAILESMTDAFFDVDATWHCTYANKAAAAWLHQSRDRFVGQSFWSLLPVFEAEPVGSSLRRAMDRSESVELETTDPDGKLRIEVRAHPSSSGLAIYLRDVTERAQAASEIYRREQAFMALAEHSPDVISRFDADLRHQYINGTIEHITGRPPSDFIGKTVREIVGFSDALDEWEDRVRKVLATGREQSLEFAEQVRAGRRYFETRMVPELAPDGRVESVLAVTRDVTELHRTAEAQRFLARAGAELATSLDDVATLNRVARLALPILADWSLVHLVDEGVVSRTAIAHTDATKEPLIHELQERYPVGLDRDHPIADVLRTGQSCLIADGASLLEQIARDPEHRAMLEALGLHEMIVVPLTARGRTIGALTLAAADSSRTYSAADIMLAEELATRAALAVDNAKLYSAAQQALGMRDQLLSVVSHDLKNPLGIIRTSAQLLRRRVRKLDGVATERLDDGLRVIDAATVRMDKQINDLLDIASVEAGHALDLRREPTDLVALVRRIGEEQQATTTRHAINVVTELETLVGSFDEERLQRVFANLIANAIKYSPNGGTILVDVGRDDAPTPPHAVISVSDQGIGIPPAEQPYVFEQFHRASNAARKFGGSGVGLASARQITRQHGGEITVKSTEGQGSTFTVRLPLPDREQPTSA